MVMGIITFHWATNVGAVLQTYAMQEYLSHQGHEVLVINYKPKHFDKSFAGLFKLRRPYDTYKEFRVYGQEKQLEIFRQKNLHLTKRYYSIDQLKADCPKVDALICGSDQIWNPSFTLNGENKPTAAYFLDFGDEELKRIAYAVSFGCTNYPVECCEFVEPMLKHFNAISVREDTGLNILRTLGYKNVKRVIDPSALLSSESYYRIIGNCSRRNNIGVYILRRQNKETKDLISLVLKHINSFEKLLTIDYMSLEQWLFEIASCGFIVTNSFHGIMMCLKFHTPFCAITETDTHAGMNDRIYTLLRAVDLESRIVLDKSDFARLNQAIDWEKVDNLLNEKVKESETFLNEVL